MAKRLEEAEQIALIRWSMLVHVGAYRLSDLLLHYPAGGWRSPVEAARFKAMGVQAGVPDLQLPVPVDGYAGGWWELKVGRNKTTPQQTEQHAKLRALGHYVQTYWHWHEAAADMVRYLERGPWTVVVRARP